jgi:hypothetical protein
MDVPVYFSLLSIWEFCHGLASHADNTLLTQESCVMHFPELSNLRKFEGKKA